MRASAVAALVFANSHDELLGKLTDKRSMASVPFGGRYRLIDFVLSNLVNAKIFNVGVITKGNYRSLMDHLGSGIFWDLDRKNAGLRLLPPYNISGAKRYNGYVEALFNAMDFITRSGSEYIVLSESSIVANIDVSAAIAEHIKKKADVTVVYHKGKFPQNFPDTMKIQLDGDERIRKIDFPTDTEEVCSHSLGIAVFTTKVLIKLITNAYNTDAFDIYRDILAQKVNSLKLYGFCHQGYACVLDSPREYFNANMCLLNADIRKALFNPTRPVYTKTRDDMPTRYGTRSAVQNSFIADGCIVNGAVKNSILFRGVTVERDAVVENCILMQGVAVADNARLSNVICDKNAVIGENMVLSGSSDKAFFVKKNQIV